jgi:dCMP deaminase
MENIEQTMAECDCHTQPMCRALKRCRYTEPQVTPTYLESTISQFPVLDEDHILRVMGECDCVTPDTCTRDGHCRFDHPKPYHPVFPAFHKPRKEGCCCPNPYVCGDETCGAAGLSEGNVPLTYTGRPSRDEVYLAMAEILATRGTCPRRKVGCVITDVDGRVLAVGYNGVASGRPHCHEPGRACPGAGYPSGQGLEFCEAIHAEQNAILQLSDARAAHTIYTTAFPCHSCLKLLLGTAAKRIVYREAYSHPESHTWWTEAGRVSIHLPNSWGI